MAEKSRAAFNNANAYEAYMGRWSRLVAKQFVDWLHERPSRVWLDVGAGTGMLTQAILSQAAPKKVVALEPSEPYREHARHTIRDDRIEFIAGDLNRIISAKQAFDVVVAGLVLNFMPSPENGVHAMTQAAAPSGTVSAYVWDYGDRMEMIRHFWDAAATVDPAASEKESRNQYAICHPEPLQGLFESAGLANIEVIPIDIQTTFKNFDDYWIPLLGAQGSVSTYLNSLSDEQRTALRSQLLRQLPVNSDHTIELTARAWAIKGSR